MGKKLGIGCGALLLLGIVLIVAIPAPESSSGSRQTGSTASRPAPSRTASAEPSDITFQEVYSTFSIHSSLTELQKEARWKDYEGKCVEWTGELAHLDEGLFGGISIGFKHRPQTFTYDVLVSAPSKMKDELLTWNMGQRYTYRATLRSHAGAILPTTADWGCDG